MVLEILASVVDGRTAIYLSAPITTGKRFLEWHTRNDEERDLSQFETGNEHIPEIVKANRSQARSLARELRHALAKVLIDPTAVADLPEWTQDDYRYLWAGLIERYVDTVVFIDGWQYSNGCVHEFLAAQRSGATTLNQNRQLLTREDGIQLIRAAITEMGGHSLPTAFLEQVVEELVQWHSDTGGKICAE